MRKVPVYRAHESAIIDSGARIGPGTHIWHWVHVCSGAVIGSHCSLGQNVFVSNKVVIGNNVKIQNNVSVYDERPDSTSVYAQYTVIAQAREQILNCLAGDGIPTAVHYPLPIHLQPAYHGFAASGSLPVAECLARQVLSLPMYPGLDYATQDRIVAALVRAAELTAIRAIPIQVR
jgi:hypothetical protein